MSISIRSARPGDAPDIARIYKSELGYGYMTEDMVRANLNDMAARGGYVNCVALEGERVVGVLSAHKELKLEADGECMQVLGLAVDARAQRTGVGRALIEQVERLANAQGVRLIYLTSGCARTGAHAFYERMGYARTGYRFVKGSKHQHRADD